MSNAWRCWRRPALTCSDAFSLQALTCESPPQGLARGERSSSGLPAQEGGDLCAQVPVLEPLGHGCADARLVGADVLVVSSHRHRSRAVPRCLTRWAAVRRGNERQPTCQGGVDPHRTGRRLPRFYPAAELIETWRKPGGPERSPRVGVSVRPRTTRLGVVAPEASRQPEGRSCANSARYVNRERDGNLDDTVHASHRNT
jgi:hypothetical protein